MITVILQYMHNMNIYYSMCNHSHIHGTIHLILHTNRALFSQIISELVIPSHFSGRRGRAVEAGTKDNGDDQSSALF